MPGSERYVVISSDGHAGAELHAYRDYLERAYLGEFDEWAKTFVSPWDDLRAETAYRNWDSGTRLRELEALRAARVAAFVRTAGQASAQQSADVINAKLQKIVNISTSEPKPFVYTLSAGGALTRLKLRRG